MDACSSEVPSQPAPDPVTKDTARTSVVIDGRYITDYYPGIGRYVFNLARALATAAPEQHLSLLVDRGERQTRFDFRSLESCGVSLVPVRSGPRSVLGHLDIRRECRRLSATLFHAPHILSAGRVACPSLVTVHDLIPMTEPGALKSFRHRLFFRTLLRRALASATAVITPSKTVACDLNALCGVASERITVVPEAADPSFQPIPQEQCAGVRERLGLPERYILSVGTDRPHKNLSRLVEAWGLLADEQRSGCHLVIAGTEDARHAQARKRARELDPKAVQFLGRVDERDLAAVYSGAQLVVQPSLCEGFGLPLIEAMACRVPVACSRTPVFDEVSGGAALKFDPTDVGDMRTAIARALNEEQLREQLVSRGVARANELSWAQTAKLTLGAYRKARRRHAAGDIGP